MIAYKYNNWLIYNGINWYAIANNPNTLDLLEVNLAKINWFNFLNNPSAIHLLQINRTDWICFVSNLNMIDLIESNLDKINWDWISVNSNVINLTESNSNKINQTITINGNVNQETNPDEIIRGWLAINPNIFEIDYNQLKQTKHNLHHDLIEEMWHPKRIQMHLDTGMDLEEYLQ